MKLPTFEDYVALNKRTKILTHVFGQLSLPGRFLKFLFRGNIQIFRNQNEFLCILGPKVFDFKGIFGATMRKGICYDFRRWVHAKACFSTIVLCTCVAKRHIRAHFYFWRCGKGWPENFISKILNCHFPFRAGKF